MLKRRWPLTFIGVGMTWLLLLLLLLLLLFLLLIPATALSHPPAVAASPPALPPRPAPLAAAPPAPRAPFALLLLLVLFLLLLLLLLLLPLFLLLGFLLVLLLLLQLMLLFLLLLLSLLLQLLPLPFASTLLASPALAFPDTAPHVAVTAGMSDIFYKEPSVPECLRLSCLPESRWFPGTFLSTDLDSYEQSLNRYQLLLAISTCPCSNLETRFSKTTFTLQLNKNETFKPLFKLFVILLPANFQSVACDTLIKGNKTHIFKLIYWLQNVNSFFYGKVT